VKFSATLINASNAAETYLQADAIANYSHLFRRSEGLYLTYPYEDAMEEAFLDQTKGRKLDLIVCSDAEAILGIGDQGVGVSLLVLPEIGQTS
jgi:malate dehydrogenase (oxaloacetate-decarboxylating)